MKITKKINPSKPEDSSEKVARQAFFVALAEMRTLPLQKIEFYICCNFQFADEKKADGCFLVLGEQTTAWKQTIKSELKTNKNRVLIGIASISKDNKFLQLQIELGAAKKSIVRKGLKAWLNKVGLKLEFTGGEVDPEDVDTDEEIDVAIDMPESNPVVAANKTTQLLAQAAAIAPKVAQLQQQDASTDARKQLVKELLLELPTFLDGVRMLTEVPPKLTDFAAKAQIIYNQLDIQLAEARFQALSAQLQSLISQLTPTT